MNVETGRFISQDNLEGNQFEPKSLHKYLYAENDPVNRVDPSAYAEASLAGTFIGFSFNSILSTMSSILARVAVVAVACALEAAVTNTLNESGIDTEPKTPCGIGPKDYVKFVHGTSMQSALIINTVGVEFDAILNSGTGSWNPGAFFTFLLEPNPGLAMELAGDFALRKPAPRAIIVGKMPRRTFNKLKSSGAVISSELQGAGYDETLFLPQSFSALNYYNLGKWEVIPR